jgi:hypothetical protein
LKKYKEILRIQHADCGDVQMQRIAEAWNREKEEVKKVDFYNASRTYAETALKIDSAAMRWRMQPWPLRWEGWH